jgi:hypothetical protein
MIVQIQLDTLKNNILKIIQPYVNKKLELWLITHYYDSKYINNTINTQTIHNGINTCITQEIEDKSIKPDDLNSLIKLKCVSYLNDIFHIDDITLKYNKILNLTNNASNLILTDSFCKKDTSIDKICNDTFTNNKYNIVIFGAGPCGLYMANLLKSHYKDKIEIIIIENRINEPHIKKKYSRKWLTKLTTSIFKGDSQIKKILMEFGHKNYIGCHINVFEMLLYLSCRKMDIKFLFKNVEDLSYLKKTNIDLIFNATGNRLFKNTLTPVSIVNIPFNFKNIIKVNNYYENNYNPNTNIEKLQLETHNDILYSKYDNKSVKWNIIKIINIPVSKYNDLERFIKILNMQDNKVYLWKGHLKEAFNECLIFINILENEINMSINQNITLENLINHIYFCDLSDKIIVLLQYLQYLYPNNTIIIEKPFVYRPYINMSPIISKYNHTIVNIGDSIFNGDPKLGDGLLWHLDIINKICESINMILS